MNVDSRNSGLDINQTSDNIQMTTLGALNDQEAALQYKKPEMPIQDQTDGIKLIRSDTQIKSKKIRKAIIAVVIFLIIVIGGGTFLMYSKFLVKDEVMEKTVTPEVIEEPQPETSWDKCGSKSLLAETAPETFGTISDPCQLAEGESPFSIMVYRSSEDFYSSIDDRRPIFIDEIESDSNLQDKILAFLTDATSQRGISTTTKYGLVNGWVDSAQAVQNCGTIEDTGPITKVLGTKACFPIFEISYI